jgi:hypothetical protein
MHRDDDDDDDDENAESPQSVVDVLAAASSSDVVMMDSPLDPGARRGAIARVRSTPHAARVTTHVESATSLVTSHLAYAAASWPDQPISAATGVVTAAATSHDADVAMSPSIVEPSAPLTSIANITGASPVIRVSPFTRVMVEPCLATLLGLMSVKERFRVMTVATSWLIAVRRPALWSNFEWRSHGSVSDLPPRWLRQCIGMISGSLTLSSTSVRNVFMEFAHLRVFDVDLSVEAVEGEANMTIARVRSAFRLLMRLESLTIHSSPHSVIDAIFGSADEVIDPSDVSTHPAVWSWCDTLQRLDLLACPLRLLSTVLQRRWSALRQLSVSVYQFDDGPVHQQQAKLESFEQFLTARCLPSLQRLSICFYVSSSAIDDALQRVVHQAVTHELPRLVDFHCQLTLDDDWQDKRLSLPAIPATLSKLRIAGSDGFSKLQPMSQLLELRINLEASEVWHHSAHDVFQAIGAHNMPVLHTLELACRSELIIDGHGKSHAAEHERVRQIMAGMNALTALHTEEEDSTIQHFCWIEHVHLFPSLDLLEMNDARSEEGPASIDSESRLSFLGSIARAPQLGQLIFCFDFIPDDFNQLAFMWYQRCAPVKAKKSKQQQGSKQKPTRASARQAGIEKSTSSVISGAAPVIHTLNLGFWAGQVGAIRAAISFLVDFPSLTDLTLHIDHHVGGPLLQLSNLSSVRSLRRLTLTYADHPLTDELVHRWTAPGGFPSLCTLTLPGLAFFDPPSSHELTHVGLDRLLSLPALYTLDIEEMPSTIRRQWQRMIDKANAGDRSPPFELHVRDHPLDHLIQHTVLP